MEVFILHIYSIPQQEWSYRNSAMFGMIKIEWQRYQMMNESDGQWQTNREMDSTDAAYTAPWLDAVHRTVRTDWQQIKQHTKSFATIIQLKCNKRTRPLDTQQAITKQAQAKQKT